MSSIVLNDANRESEFVKRVINMARVYVFTYGDVKTYTNGTIMRHRNNLLHCEDGPAIIEKNTYRRVWCYNGLVHRVDGPAYISSTGNEWWVLNGIIHRVDGPAFTLVDKSTNHWYLNGVLHRIGAPAVVEPHGNSWFVNGLQHRIGGPSFDYEGSKAWYIHGVRHRIGGPAVDISGHRQEWYRWGVHHRIGGPAITIYRGAQRERQWWKFGIRHRVSGPAHESHSLCRWYQQGLLHRLDGPADTSHGYVRWYYKGQLHRDGYEIGFMYPVDHEPWCCKHGKLYSLNHLRELGSTILRFMRRSRIRIRVCRMIRRRVIRHALYTSGRLYFPGLSQMINSYE